MSRNGARPPGLRHIAGIPGDEATPCATDPEMWFPPGTTWDGHARQAEDAKRACGTCPLIEPCLRWALDTREPYAIAGGTTPRERQKILNRPATKTDACGTRKGYEAHRRRGEKTCDACKAATAAHAQRQRERQADEIWRTVRNAVAREVIA